MEQKTPYLYGENVEDVGRMVMALLSEFWVLRDRVAILEEMLGEKTGITPEALDAYVPSPELEAKLTALRDKIARTVVGAPMLARDRSVKTILGQA